MKIAITISRILLGLIYLASSLAFFFNLMPAPEMEGAVGQFMIGVSASGYMLQVVKIFELVCAIALISGRFVPLAAVVIFPITLNVFLFHAFLVPAGLPVAIFLLAANLFVAYANRGKYQPLVMAR
ncbi:MAG: DoxX family membrane protein [Cyclobacteriaceae bacterium]